MKLYIALLLASCFMSVAAVHGWAQAPGQEDDVNGSLTAQQWQQRVDDARRRTAEFVAHARSRMSEPVQSEGEDAKAADERAMNDPSLRAGDIVATSKGFLIFVGRDEGDRQPSDFKPVPENPSAQSSIRGR